MGLVPSRWVGGQNLVAGRVIGGPWIFGVKNYWRVHREVGQGFMECIRGVVLLP